MRYRGESSPLWLWVVITIASALLVSLAGCHPAQKAQSTEQLAAGAGQSVDRADTKLAAAQDTIGSMTPDNLADTKPTAKAQVDGARADLKEAKTGIAATVKSAKNDAAKIDSYEKDDVVRSALEWVAWLGILGGVGALVLSVLPFIFAAGWLSWLTRPLQKTLAACGALALAFGIGAGWTLQHLATIYTITGILFWIGIAGGVGIIIYVFIMHGSASNGAWAFVAAVEAFFVGLWHDVIGWFRGAKAMLTGKTGDTTLIPPAATVTPPPAQPQTQVTPIASPQPAAPQNQS